MDKQGYLWVKPLNLSRDFESTINLQLQGYYQRTTHQQEPAACSAAEDSTQQSISCSLDCSTFIKACIHETSSIAEIDPHTVRL
jgi:hypothetical protein